MSLKQLSSISFGELLALLLIIGLVMVFGSLGILAIVVSIYPSWLISGITAIIPVVIVGLIIVAISVKMMEWFE